MQDWQLVIQSKASANTVGDAREMVRAIGVCRSEGRRCVQNPSRASRIRANAIFAEGHRNMEETLSVDPEIER